MTKDDNRTLAKLYEADKRLRNADKATLAKLDNVDKKLTNMETAALGRHKIAYKKLRRLDKGIEILFFIINFSRFRINLFS